MSEPRSDNGWTQDELEKTLIHVEFDILWHESELDRCRMQATALRQELGTLPVEGEKVKIDELTIGEARQLASMFSTQHVTSADVTGPWEIGKNYLIRTVTMIDTGKLVGVGPSELVLESAAWVADTGRFSGALQSCEFSEVEPFPEGRLIVGRGSVIDAIQIPTLPLKQK